MRVLIDTHVLLWWLGGNPRLSAQARTTIRSSEAVFVSAATAWEIAIKVAAGKLEFHGDMEQQLALNSFQALPITVAHATAAGSLPRHHNDPFDRMLVAQALQESLTLMTTDDRLGVYGVPVLDV